MAVEVKYTTGSQAAGGGRNGVSKLVNGMLSVTMASPKQVGGSGLGLNPGERFAVGFAACSLGGMRYAAGTGKLGTVPPAATVNAAVGMGPRSDGGFGIALTRTVSMPGVDPGAALAHH